MTRVDLEVLADLYRSRRVRSTCVREFVVMTADDPPLPVSRTPTERIHPKVDSPG